MQQEGTIKLYPQYGPAPARGPNTRQFVWLTTRQPEIPLNQASGCPPHRLAVLWDGSNRVMIDICGQRELRQPESTVSTAMLSALRATEGLPLLSRERRIYPAVLNLAAGAKSIKSRSAQSLWLRCHASITPSNQCALPSKGLRVGG